MQQCVGKLRWGVSSSGACAPFGMLDAYSHSHALLIVRLLGLHSITSRGSIGLDLLAKQWSSALSESIGRSLSASEMSGTLWARVLYVRSHEGGEWHEKMKQDSSQRGHCGTECVALGILAGALATSFGQHS